MKHSDIVIQQIIYTRDCLRMNQVTSVTAVFMFIYVNDVCDDMTTDAATESCEKLVLNSFMNP